MKKTLAMIISLILVIALSACGTSGTIASSAVASSSSTAQAASSGSSAQSSKSSASSSSTASASSAPAGSSIVLKICLSESNTDIKASIMQDVVNKIEERTNGRVSFELYYSDALGSIDETIEQMSMGGNILAGSSGEKWAAYGCADMTGLNMMYVFASPEAVLKFNDSDLWAKMKSQMAEKGITMLCMNWASAPRVVMSTKAINSVADFKNLIMRVPSSTYGSFFEAMGASTTSMKFSEIYSSMQSGVIQACEAPLSVIDSYSLQEVAKNVFLSEHSYASCCYGTSTAIWNKISADDQKIIIEEFTSGGKTFTEKNIETNATYQQKMKDAGVTLVTPSDSDKTAMAAAAAESFKKFPELSANLLADIQAACK